MQYLTLCFIYFLSSSSIFLVKVLGIGRFSQEAGAFWWKAQKCTLLSSSSVFEEDARDLR